MLPVICKLIILQSGKTKNQVRSLQLHVRGRKHRKFYILVCELITNFLNDVFQTNSKKQNQ